MIFLGIFPLIKHSLAHVQVLQPATGYLMQALMGGIVLIIINS
jgi:hypothetical protein